MFILLASIWKHIEHLSSDTILFQVFKRFHNLIDSVIEKNAYNYHIFWAFYKLHSKNFIQILNF